MPLQKQRPASQTGQFVAFPGGDTFLSPEFRGISIDEALGLVK